ncbi:glucans biosynthesis glucosyltransferase MdoH [Rubellimicrobium aerolatum]|uniref:Glucans biosynthesis glucosyltransferase H n=1 Tax=Rubellimicrobium aerolatum TaxID=490979 RepID=A0ABW0S9A9_9RHOB|nr:glucans biosynthesis glucosyltransferase MdoH [Rubellimicrobium aerolatum]MBP1804872.1 membrane glycosyltransferase [Rubellimicrobium aerolatum]
MALRTALLRAAALGLAAALAVLALTLLLRGGGVGALGLLQGLAVMVATFWLGFGTALVLLGIGAPAPRREERPFQGRAVVLIPICNEDASPIFAGIVAMDADLRAEGIWRDVDIAVLSDTRNAGLAAEEERLFRRLLEETGDDGRLFYRRRTDNRGRKAGNIEEFVRRSGGAYEYAVILDADSLMSGQTIATMLNRMEADPRLGLLQTVPFVIGARSRFGRMMAFAGAFHGPIFARGLSRLQGRTGPFWGHNAAVRVRAFAESCGLPELSGPPPFGGHVLSHDYVEAALLARAGWTVRLDPDIGGSYEEAPQNIVAYAKRDRRWCQGNLQHARILLAPGFRPWSRFVFAQGIFAYLVPLFWLSFVLLGLLGRGEARGTAALAILVVVLLLGPKLLVVLLSARRARAFGGRRLLLGSVAAEVVQSSVIAPILLMFQARSVLQVLMGRDGGWPAQARGDMGLTWADGWRSSWWITVWGLGLMALATVLAPALLPWLLPLAVPMALAPLVITWTSRPPRSFLFATPEEIAPPAILRRAEAERRRWDAPEAAPLAPAARPAMPQQVHHA